MNFAREDILYSRLRQSIKRLTTDELINGKFYRAHYNVDREIIEQEFRKMKNDYLNKLKKVVYSTSNEPVRLGAFRVLLLEAHTHLLGDLDWKLPKEVLDLAVHGIVQEKFVYYELEGNSRGFTSSKESYHSGIDYIYLAKYPMPNREGDVVVPLFVIAKSKDEDVNKIDINGAINKIIEHLGTETGSQESDSKSHRKEIALQNIPKFTRVVLTKTREIYEDSNSSGKVMDNESCLNANKNHQNIPIYDDIMCGILGLILIDIPRIYRTIVKDEELSSITMDDWITALLNLAIPISQVTVTSGMKPPDPPGGVTADNMFRMIQQEAIETLKKEIQQYKEEQEIIKKHLEEKLNRLIEKALEESSQRRGSSQRGETTV